LRSAGDAGRVARATRCIARAGPGSSQLGAAHVINAREQDPVDALQDITAGRGIDRTLEATGVPSVLRQAIDVLAPLGVCGIVGAPAPDAEVAMNILTAIVKGSSVVGINQGDAVPRESIPARRRGRVRSRGKANLVGLNEPLALRAAAGPVAEADRSPHVCEGATVVGHGAPRCSGRESDRFAPCLGQGWRHGSRSPWSLSTLRNVPAHAPR
jgi:hypothetical protein